MKIEEVIRQSKRFMRHHLANLPVAEKLRILDSLRERALAIRGKTTGSSGSVREEPTPFRVRPK
jgi:hypothetical protein